LTRSSGERQAGSHRGPRSPPGSHPAAALATSGGGVDEALEVAHR